MSFTCDLFHFFWFLFSSQRVTKQRDEKMSCHGFSVFVFVGVHALLVVFCGFSFSRLVLVSLLSLSRRFLNCFKGVSFYLVRLHSLCLVLLFLLLSPLCRMSLIFLSALLMSFIVFSSCVSCFKKLSLNGIVFVDSSQSVA